MRRHDLSEWMDMPDCDPPTLWRTYGQFGVLNDLVAGWRRAYREHLREVLRASATRRGVATLLDLGAGGGDLARRLAAWTAADGIPVQIDAVDPDPRAIAYARTRATPPHVTVRTADDATLRAEGARFDVVVSNHVLHHLSDDEARAFLVHARELARAATLHADLRRRRSARWAFAVLSLGFPGSFVRDDGRISIQRAFTPEELALLAPADHTVQRVGPFRSWVRWTGSVGTS